jgi:hypothetical protein
MPKKICNEPRCTKSSQGKNGKCIEHGGGTRCNEPECTKSAIGKTDKCIAHGGANVVMNLDAQKVLKEKLINVLNMVVAIVAQIV